MKTKLILLFSLILFVSCASSGAERKPSRPRNFISFEEIQSLSGAFTAKDVGVLARPFWLRGLAGYDPSVYINSIEMGGVESLENVSIQAIQEMKYLSPSEATTMYGTNNMGGAIEIKSR